MSRPSFRHAIAVLSLALPLALIPSCGSTLLAEGGAPRPTSMMALNSNTFLDEIKAGYQVYRKHCIACHTERVPATPPPGRPWHSNPTGQALYHSLSAGERYNVVEYLKAVERRHFSMDVGVRESRLRFER